MRLPRGLLLVGPFALAAGITPGGRFDAWAPGVPRYVLADVDGTLLGSVPEASVEVVAAVERTQRAGLRVGFATGRMRAGVQPLWEQLRATGPHILYNGAQVRDAGEIVAAWPLGPVGTAAVLDVARELGLYAELYAGDGYVVTDRRPEAAVHWRLLHQDPDGLVEDLDPDADVIKATVMAFEGDDLTAVLDRLAAAGVAVGSATSPQAPGVTFVNVNSPEVDKGRALARAAEHLGVGLDEVVAIGDGLNDLSMLAVAGTAIAMGQAPAEVRDAAHLVVPEVDAHGVAHALDACVAWAEIDPV